MVKSILLTYLRHNLLDLEGDDVRLEKLNVSATELAESISRNPMHALPMFLAAIGPDAEVKDSLDEVGRSIENNWKSYHGAFRGGKALTLYKAVALQALVEAIDIQPVLGTAISLLMRNFGPRLEIGKNKEAIDILVNAADKAYEAQLGELTPRPVEQTFTVPKFRKANKFDRASLQKRIDAAVGPHTRASEALDSANPQWPNSGEAWSHDFSDRMTLILGDYLDSVWEKAFENDAKNLEVVVSQLKLVVGQHASLNERATSLLWWRQALYSETAKQPYRELTAPDAVAHLVSDLAALIPAAYDPSLESFLMEAIVNLLPSNDEIAGSELLSTLPSASAALKAASGLTAPPGLMLFAMMHNHSHENVVQLRLPARAWAVWLLREVKALQALTNPAQLPEKESEDD